MERDYGICGTVPGKAIVCLLAMLLASGCVFGPNDAGQHPLSDEGQVVELKVVPAEQAEAFLMQLGLGDVSSSSDGHSLVLGGEPSERRRARVVLDLIDAGDRYVVEALAPLAEARSIPTNDQIAHMLGDISIGTFANPPHKRAKTRAIIDIQGETVVAIAPIDVQREIVALVRFGPAVLRQIRGETAPPQPVAAEQPTVAETPAPEPMAQAKDEPNEPTAAPTRTEDSSPEVLTALILPDPPQPPVPDVPPDIPTVSVPTAAPQPASPVIAAAEPTARTEPEPAPVDADPPCAHVKTDTAPPERVVLEPIAARPDEPPVVDQPEQDAGSVVVTPTRLEPPHGRKKQAKIIPSYELVPLTNGNDVLELDLPDKLEVVQLLDLAAEYLNLDYMYDPEKIKGHSVSLRLHGKLQGEIKVKELYPLLESVLKFKGFAMTCHAGNLVTIVPVADALQADPALLDRDSMTLGAGDMVVTRVFDLQYVNTASAMNLLEGMKLSVAASPIKETQTLIVTCYAHRMTRIERLLNMVDRPGRPKEFRYRQLKYTMAGTLAKKVEALVAELQTAPIHIAPMEAAPSLASGKPAPPTSNLKLMAPSEPEPVEAPTVYLDIDERTNRILMIGHAEQLAIVESVIDALDVAQHDPRMLRIYNIVHISAAEAEEKLQDLDVVGKSARSTSTPPPVFASKTASTTTSSVLPVAETSMGEDVQVTVLDATNSLLVNATEQQHVRIETVVGYVDVAPQDLRELKVYDIQYIAAEDVKKKLADFGVVGEKKGGGNSGAESASELLEAGGSGSEAGSAVMQSPQVAVREATNSLVVNATQPQHARIKEILELIDVVQQDLRTLKVYDIQHVDASAVKKKLVEFELTKKKSESSSAVGSLTVPESSTSSSAGERSEELPTSQEPQVAVLESTNSLLINATEFQHAQMERVIKHVDAEVQQDAIPYEIYFLENQDPETLAEVLGRLINETITSQEDKIQEVVHRTEDEIVVVPDKGTFSLIVYADKKNQDWISKLITALDKRRPQVLIDVTLVEIRKADEFNYDLNFIQSFPDLLTTSGLTGAINDSVTSSDIVEKLSSSGRSHFADVQSNGGDFTGFYGDNHINLLIQAMQTKNYGRVLAKPKVLVNDNEQGTISTLDTTYVQKSSSIPVTSGAAGTETSLIETAIDYEPYDAGITLGITPHISEGQLLRLEITLKRSDFTNITEDKPPDQTSSDMSTVVTVPDESTIILGGMLKLNQERGGSKVPILGDLPLIGGVFRSVANSDVQSMLYVFVRAEIIRPSDVTATAHDDLKRISDRDRSAFEKHESEFQDYQDWPGAKSKPMSPIRVLDAR